MNKIILIILAIVKFDMAMRSNEFCLNRNKQCVGVHSAGSNVYTEKCHQLKCQGENSYECEKDFCSSNKRTCNRFYQIHKLVKSLKQNSVESFKQSKYVSFSKGFLECPPVEYDVKLTDICLNTRSCLYMEVDVNTVGEGKKRLACPCFGQTGYHCGYYHCATHSTACEAFKSTGFNSSSFKVGKCASFNVFAQRLKIKN